MGEPTQTRDVHESPRAQVVQRLLARGDLVTILGVELVGAGREQRVASLRGIG